MAKSNSVTFRVTTSRQIKAAVDRWSEHGDYRSRGAFIEACVREKLLTDAQSRLDAKLMKSLKAPVHEVTTDLMEQVLTGVRKRHAARRKSSPRGPAARNRDVA